MAVRRGASYGSVPITERASSNVTSGVHIVARAGSCSGRVLLGVGPLVAGAGINSSWRYHRVGVGNT